MKKEIAIIMGSDSDLEIMKDAAKVLDDLKVSYELTVVSAHRTPKRMYEFATNAKERGIKVIIAAAGGAAHLPGMTASLTTLPVIGVPIKTKTMDGVDSFLSMAQMPAGIPVATVAINGAVNASLLALEILATNNKNISAKLSKYKSNLKLTVIKKAKSLEALGYKKYLKS